MVYLKRNFLIFYYVIAVALIAFVIIGCAKITFKNGEISYSRLGSQKLEGLKIQLADGTKIELGKQEGSAGNLSEAVKNATETTLRLIK